MGLSITWAVFSTPCTNPVVKGVAVFSLSLPPSNMQSITLGCVPMKLVSMISHEKNVRRSFLRTNCVWEI